jgi:RND family efflux transporter MFP subunit
MPPAPVRYTEAREQSLRRQLSFPGTVEALTTSTLAASIAGQVVDYPAKEGLRLKAGDVLARLDTVQAELRLEVQRAALREAQARLKLAESNLARARELFESEVISKQQLDDSQSEFAAWQGRADFYKAEIARIQDEIRRATVRAPFSCVVVRERTEVGQWLAIGDPVADVLAMDEVEVRVDVPERYFALLRAGVAATLSFEGLPGFAPQGRIIAVIPQADAQARTFPVKVRVANPQGHLAAGMLAQVSFPAGETYRATMVPKDAVIARGERKFLYRINGESAVEEVMVETGAGAGAWIEVRGAVQPGDKVVTRGNERLRPGQQVVGSPLAYERPS